MNLSYMEAGLLSGIVPTIILYPLDQIKNQVASGVKISHVINKKAITFDLLSCIISSGIYWQTYNLSRDWVNPYMSSIFAVTLSTVVDTPIDWYKRKYQIGSSINFSKIKYYGYGIISSYIYNLVWISYMKNTKNAESNTILNTSIASLLASISTYTLDIKRTQLLSNYSIFSMKGFMTYIMYKVSYSTIYMGTFFYLTSKVLK